MQKAKIFKRVFSRCGYACICAAWLWGTSVSAMAQPVLGQIIEQAKKNKLAELLAPPALAPGAVSSAPVDLVGLDPNIKKNSFEPRKAESELPMLWSMSGINTQWVAEIWVNSVMHRLLAVPGQKMPGGWEVTNASSSTLTLASSLKRFASTQPAEPAPMMM